MQDVFLQLYNLSGFPILTWQMVTMWGVALVLLYLAVYKGFEPLLLVPIAFGAFLANLPTKGLVNEPGTSIVMPVLDHGTDPATGEPRHLPTQFKVLKVLVEPGQAVEAGDPLLQWMGEVTMPDGRTVWGRGQVRAEQAGVIEEFSAEAGDLMASGDSVASIRYELDGYNDHPGGLFYYIYKGIDWEIYPPLIFLGVGALTDFGPLIANPRVLLLGGAAQFGVIITFFGTWVLGRMGFGFTPGDCASVAIIGGADGPTAIFTAAKLAPELLPAIAVAAYSYMALVPLIQPPIMRALTTEEERKIRMKSLRQVSKHERLLFALVVTAFCILLVPSAAALIGMLMLGNFLRECGVTERLVKAAQNEIINITTILLGTSVGITMTGERFLRGDTLAILGLGVFAFVISTAAGVLMAKFMNLFLTKDKINPLIGSAGVSAVPMAARVSHTEGQRADPRNYLLMHAMGPNVAGVIGTALVAGYFIATLGH